MICFSFKVISKVARLLICVLMASDRKPLSCGMNAFININDHLTVPGASRRLQVNVTYCV